MDVLDEMLSYAAMRGMKRKRKCDEGRFSARHIVHKNLDGSALTLVHTGTVYIGR